MDKKDLARITEFAKLALARNDDSIRFAESKAAFLFTFVGVMLGFFTSDLTAFKAMLVTPSVFQIPSVIALLFILVGLGIVVYATLLTVVPRLTVAKQGSFLYFGTIVQHKEQEFYEKVSALEDTDVLSHLLAQMYATSQIVTRKYYYVRLGMIGAVLVLAGFVTAGIVAFLAA